MRNDSQGEVGENPTRSRHCNWRARFCHWILQIFRRRKGAGYSKSQATLFILTAPSDLRQMGRCYESSFAAEGDTPFQKITSSS